MKKVCQTILAHHCAAMIAHLQTERESDCDNENESLCSLPCLLNNFSTTDSMNDKTNFERKDLLTNKFEIVVETVKSDDEDL